jgi:hypothetical protein
MRLPQSSARPLSARVFSSITVILFATMLPLCVRAATPQLTCTASSLRFGNVLIGQNETAVVVLTNGGQTSVTVSAMKVSNAEFSASQLRLPLSLSAGQSVPINVTFSPTVTGWTGGWVIFTSNASNPTLYVELQGTGAKSDTLAASPSSVSFGQVAVKASSTRSVVLTNLRTYKVTISAWQATGSGFSVSGPALPITLNGGQSITLRLTFAPQSAGMSGGSVFVPGPALNVPLSGTGTTTTAGKLTIAPALVNFGDVNVGATGTQALTLSASGASVTVSSDASSNSQFVLNGASLPFTIAAGQSKSYNVSFAPKASGTVSGSLSFTSNAGTSQMLESLTGIGAVQQHSVNLSWNASTGVVGYNIYRSTSSNGTYAKINSTVDANTAYTDGAVAAGQTYYYEATGVNSSGQESGRSTPPVQASIP